jgi:hypothetical protein
MTDTIQGRGRPWRPRTPPPDVPRVDDKMATLVKFSTDEVRSVVFSEIRAGQTYWLSIKDNYFVEFVKENETYGRRVSEPNGGVRCDHSEVAGLFLKQAA